MSDVSDFLVCSFCNRAHNSPDVFMIVRSEFSRGACVCDICIRGLSVMVANAYNGMFEDNGYHLDGMEDKI